ncbi:hypothetical protein JCM10212_000098 [Sporobolomyces blumeae]
MSSTAPGSTLKITVHWLDQSRAQRILWLLEELELPYELKVYKRDAKTMLAPPELKAVHPLGKSPVVEIVEPSSSTPLVLAESGAICEFLIERYGEKLGVKANEGDFKDRADYLYWLHWAEGTAMTPLMMGIVFAQIPKQAPFLVRPIISAVSAGVHAQFIRPRLKSNYAYVDEWLNGKEFFVGGRLTGADIMMSFIAESLEAAPIDQAPYGNIRRWHQQMQSRAAYQRAEAKGGKNDLTMFVK